MVEKVVVLNGYGGSNQQGPRLAAMLRGLSFTVALISELGQLVDDLQKVGRVYYNRAETPHDVGIVVANPVVGRVGKVIRFLGKRLTRFVHRGGDKPMLWRDRWVVRVRILNRVYYAVHGNAVIAGPGGGWLQNEGASVWRSALRELDDMIRADIRNGLRIRIGGDFNFPESDVPLSPNEFFEDLGLDWRSDGRVMFIAWDPHTDRLLDFKVLPTAPGADAHKVLAATLVKRKERKNNLKGKALKGKAPGKSGQQHGKGQVKDWRP